ncbi:DEKNAAC101870 [Brettanomyces naardenensis]|uniref:DEKNAAC101870 n=1 Tax=Brettanomyces naardenensis TaxID=13370 RepID=A0A448YJB4_BRENA|nr:DEKNAAC101870 [Brettanomyces naardenensis]
MPSSSPSPLTWHPLHGLTSAKVVRPFQPLEGQVSKAVAKTFRNLYPGDLVYLFESTSEDGSIDSDLWGRGYVVSQPVPSDFSAASTNLASLPKSRTAVIVVPFSCLAEFEEMQVPDETETAAQNILDQSAFDDGALLDDIAYDNTSSQPSKPSRPSVPLDSLSLASTSSSLAHEITLQMKNLAVVMFALYAQNDIEFFKKLVDIFKELDDLRINMSHGLLTKWEDQVARKNIVMLFNRIAKLLASSGGKINRGARKTTRDVSGSDSILARDEMTGELFDIESADPARVAQNQLLGALSPNYPLMRNAISFVPEKNHKFEAPAASNILIDFKEVSGSSAIVPKGYDGMTAFMYLRNAKKRLTQAFSVTINPDQAVFLDNLSAALFTNIPASEVDSGKIYLVAILTERIKLSVQKSTSEQTLKSIRKGICAGVADVSRVFSRKKSHLASGEAHRFVVKLFSSFLVGHQKQPQDISQLYPGMNQKIAMSIAMANSGWGELVDRIISGSDKGVAVNPRAEKLILSIKELREEVAAEDAPPSPTTPSSGDPFSPSSSLDAAEFAPLRRVSTNSSSAGSATSALASINTISFNPLASPPELIYLRVAKFGDLGIKFSERTFLTVELRSSSSRIRFAGGANEATKASWQFLSLAPAESLNEVVQISGISRPTNSDSDYLFFDVFANGSLLGRGKYLLRSQNRVFDTGLFLKKGQSVDIVGSQGNQGIGALEFDLKYVGGVYNVDDAAEGVLRWRDHQDSGYQILPGAPPAPHGAPPAPPIASASGSGVSGSSSAAASSTLASSASDLSSLLSRFRRSDTATLAKFFPQLLYNLINIFDHAISTGNSGLKASSFEAIVHMLDVTIARHRDYVTLFDQFIAQYGHSLPAVGEILLSRLTAHFSAFNTTWNSTGRALCRVSILLLRIADACIRHRAEFVTQGYRFVEAITAFLSSTKESLVSDQLLIFEVLELYLDILRHSFQISELATFAVAWANATGLRGLASFEDPGSNALANRRRTREHRVLISKLMFVRRLLAGFIVSQGSQTSRELVLVAAFKVSFRVLNSSIIDIECSRLALGVLLAICEACKKGYETAHPISTPLHLTLVRSLPLLATLFNRYYAYCSNNGLLKPKRVYTQLFPNVCPFTEYTMDSIVSDESFAEILIEYSVIVAFVTEIAWKCKEDVTRYLASPSNYEAAMANYAPLNEFLGPPGIALTSTEDLKDFVKALRAQVAAQHYPGDRWLSLRAMMVHAVEKGVEIVEPMMEKLADEVVVSTPLSGTPRPGTPSSGATSSFIQAAVPVTDFDPQLWTNYISALLRSATCKPASLEHLAGIPRKGCLKLTQDIRTPAAETLSTLWDLLGNTAPPEDVQRFQITHFGGHQRELVINGDHTFLSLLFLLGMQRNPKCKEVGTSIFWSIIAGEMSASENLFSLEQKCVTALYNMFEKATGYIPEAPEIKEFVNGLREALRKLDTEDVAQPAVAQFTDTIASYLDTLAGLQSIPEGEEFDDDRTFYRIKISGYLLDVDRPELFQSFVADMYNANLTKENFVQAALSLQLLADTYEWNPSVYLPECNSPSFPRQTEFRRKADLYKLIAQQLTKGSKLEQAVEVFQELLDAYQRSNFDLEGLSFCHGQLSHLYSALQSVDRLDSTFFKISFIGYGFPETIRGKQFVYEGLPYEHITSINHRLIRLYPGSRVITSDDEAAKLLIETPFGRYLHIKAVTPKKTVFQAALSFMAQQYVENRSLNTFVSTRRLPGSSSITSLWTEEATYVTYMTFPTLMNRSEIQQATVLKLSPVKNAIKSLIKQQEELASIETLIHQNLRDNVSVASLASTSMFGNLSRILAGTVDSPVNGGMGQYRVFFDKQREEENAKANYEEIAEYENDSRDLKACFSSVVSLLCRLLKLHGLIVPENLRSQHEAMLELFGSNFQREITDLQLDVATPLDYNILMDSLTSRNIRSRRRHVAGTVSPSSASSLHRRPARETQSIANSSGLANSTTISDDTNFDARATSVIYSTGDERSSFTGAATESFYSRAPSKRTILNYR